MNNGKDVGVTTMAMDRGQFATEAQFLQRLRPDHQPVETLSVSRVWNVHGTCLLAVPLLFFLHRHDDVTPSWFRALESYVLRVLAGNDEIKLWSSPSSLFTPSLLFLFLAAPLSSIIVCILLCNDIGSGAQLSCAWKRSTRLGEVPSLRNDG